MLNRFNISTSLVAILLLLSIVFSATTGISYSAFNNTSNNLQTINRGNDKVDDINNIMQIVITNFAVLNRMTLEISQNVSDETLFASANNIATDMEKADDLMKRFSENRDIETPEGIVKKQYEILKQKFIEDLEILKSRDIDTFIKVRPLLMTEQRAFQALHQEYLGKLQLIIRQADQESNNDFIMIQRLFILSIVLMIAILIGSYAWIKRNLVNRLIEMSHHFNEISKGNLSSPIPNEGKNEISRLFDSLKGMQHGLAQTVGSVRQGADAIYTGATEITMGNNDLSSRTEEQAASLAETAASMEELTSTVKQNADNARHANQLALGTSEIAQKGGEVTHEMVKTMKHIADSSQKIADITSVIDGISFQTNILALNAAVEAARAGEHGRGFAVVAGEVRNLAQRAGSAAKEIKTLIDEAVSFIHDGTQLVENVGTSMNDIVHSVTQVTDIMGEISMASEEQSKGIEQVALAVTQMDQVTQQNAALVEESAAAAASLEDQASNLSQAVGKFILSVDSRSKVVQSVDTKSTIANMTQKAPVKAATAPRQTASSGKDDDWETF